MRRIHKLPELTVKELFDGSNIPFPSTHAHRKDFTGYKELRKSPEGRKTLRERGYIVRTNTSKMGQPAAERRRANSKFAISQFIAWDGEGVTINGKHHYVLLQNSTGYCTATDNEFEPVGLSTSVCLDFLLETAAQNPGATHIIYGGNYDFNKILKDLALSPGRLRKLYDKGHVHWKHYHIEWIPRKWLWVKNMSTGQTVRLFDVISFFQMSFVKTLEKWNIVIDDMEIIETMKQRRGDFNWSNEHDAIEYYCGLELKALVKLMEEFRRNHIEAQLPLLTGWYGPGAIANGLLRTHRIKRFMLDVDYPINQAALFAFSAGRIERLLYGNYEGPTRIIDINSAYPYSISRLPSLIGGWRLVKQVKEYPIYPMSLYHVKMYHHNLYASPLFYRKSNDNIYFPIPKGDSFIETWIWTPEYEQLVKWSIPHEVVECYLFQGDINSRPFEWMEEMYYKRLEWKEAGNPAEKNLKLALNSIYGKTVQQAGFEHRKKIPIYHQIEWGGYITSSTRAQLYDAMAQINFENIIGVETDSIIIASNQIPQGIDYSNRLGSWGVTDYEGITYVQSGVYWLKQNGEWLDKYSKGRGYVPGTLKRDDVLATWESNPFGEHLVDDNSQAIGMRVDAIGNEFMTLGHCFMPGSTLDKWGDWKCGPKKLSLWRDSKRRIKRSFDPRMGLLKTYDHTELSGWSKQYDIVWGKDIESNPY